MREVKLKERRSQNNLLGFCKTAFKENNFRDLKVCLTSISHQEALRKQLKVLALTWNPFHLLNNQQLHNSWSSKSSKHSLQVVESSSQARETRTLLISSKSLSHFKSKMKWNLAWQETRTNLKLVKTSNERNKRYCTLSKLGSNLFIIKPKTKTYFNN